MKTNYSNSNKQKINCRRGTKTNAGFTLTELLVSIFIFTIISAVALFNNAQFNSSIVLSNLAYEVALSIRQAQSYGISVRLPSGYTAFESGYGVHFAGNTGTYSLFEDKDPIPGNGILNSNKSYDGASEDIRIFNITKGNKISKLCVTNNTSTNCYSEIDIVFLRPNPDAIIRRTGITTNYQSAYVCVSSPTGTHRKIFISNTGQISVSAPGTECN